MEVQRLKLLGPHGLFLVQTRLINLLYWKVTVQGAWLAVGGTQVTTWTVMSDLALSSLLLLVKDDDIAHSTERRISICMIVLNDTLLTYCEESL